jgi:hypothetical protein
VTRPEGSLPALKSKIRSLPLPRHRPTETDHVAADVRRLIIFSPCPSARRHRRNALTPRLFPRSSRREEAHFPSPGRIPSLYPLDPPTFSLIRLPLFCLESPAHLFTFPPNGSQFRTQTRFVKPSVLSSPPSARILSGRCCRFMDSSYCKTRHWLVKQKHPFQLSRTNAPYNGQVSPGLSHLLPHARSPSHHVDGTKSQLAPTSCHGLSPHLSRTRPFPSEVQHQPYDNVLRGRDRHRNAFAAACFYIAANPVKAQLCESPTDWPFIGSIVPGYPHLDFFSPDFWPTLAHLPKAPSTRCR